HLLGGSGPSKNREKQSRISVAEISQICFRFSADLHPRHLSLLLQRSSYRARQSIPLGLPADFRRRRPPHQFPRDAQTGLTPLRSRSDRRSSDRRFYSGLSNRRSKNLGLVTEGSRNCGW